MPGSGSSDHIVLVARAFLEPGSAALVSQYSFAAYQGAIASVGARTISVPTRDFHLDVERMLAAIDDSVRVVYIATPNNPTGTRIEAAARAELIARLPERGVVVLVDAYRGVSRSGRPPRYRPFTRSAT